MTKADKLELPNLSNDVREALKQWQSDANAESPLRYLYLFRKTQREGHSNPRQATNDVLVSAIEVLKQTHEADAKLLQMRFLDLWPIHRLVHHLNVAESTLYTLQRQAIERLTETLGDMEFQAREAQKALLNERLRPATYVNLIGVESHLTYLSNVLSMQGPPWVVSVEGLGGIGKTSLAHAVMRQCVEQRVYDEIGWVSAHQNRFNLGGALTAVEQPALTTAALLEALVQQLMPEAALQVDHSPERLLTLLQARLKALPHLIVIDNLETLLDVESLLPTLQKLANPTKFVLTSRTSYYSEPNLYHFRVPELSTADALQLVRQEAKLSNLPLLAMCTDAELLPIVETVGGNPLAIRLVVGQMHVHPLEVILADLRHTPSQTAETFYNFIYRQAWEKLDSLSQQVLLMMPLASPSGTDLEFLAEVGDIEIGELRMALNNLVMLNLVDVRGGLHNRRYSIHALTRTFLQEQVAKWL